MKKPTLWIDMDDCICDFLTSFKKDIKKQLNKLRRDYRFYTNFIKLDYFNPEEKPFSWKTLHYISYEDFIQLCEERKEGLVVLESLIFKLNNLLENKIKPGELNLSEKEKSFFVYPQSRKNFLLYLKPIPGAKETIEKLKKFFDVKILTKPSYMNPGCYTEKRLWVEFNYDLEMCKHLYFAPDKSYILGDYLIDDNPWDDFIGIQLQYGTKGLEDWDKVFERLMELIK